MPSIENSEKLRIFSCLKQVPDEREMATDPKSGSLLRDNAGSIPNPDDLAALELALRTGEILQREEIKFSLSALTMGPKQARASLRQALALGFDRGIHLQDKLFAGSDVLVTANTLAQVIDVTGGADIVICGEKSADGDTGQLPAELSVWLKASFLPFVKEIISIDQEEIVVCSQIDQWETILKAKLPVVLQIKADAARLRPISFRSRREAQAKTLLRLDSSDLEASIWRGYQGSPTKVRGMFVPAKSREAQVFQGPGTAKKFAQLKAELIDQPAEEEFKEKTLPREEITAGEEQPQGSLVVLLENSEQGVYKGVSLLSKLQKYEDCQLDILLIKGENEDFILPEFLTKNADRLVLAASKEEILTANCAAHILADYLKDRKAELCLIAATDFGRTAGPLAAALLQTGITADLTELSYLEDEWEQIRPAYGGQVLARIITPSHRPVLCTVRPGVWDLELKNEKEARILSWPARELSLSPSVEIISRKVLEEDEKITEASKILIAGGAISRAEELELLIAYAKANDFDWAVTRPLVQGYLSSHKRQIGVSGLSIAPDLALLIGVSGSIQTMSGLTKAKTIIAVNNDMSAAVFQNSDYGFVGDWREILQLG